MADKELPQKPLIAVSGKMEMKDGKKTSSKSVLNMKALLEKEGAEVVIIDHGPSDPKNLKAYAGVVFMGNDFDIDPASYGKPKDPKTNSELDPNAALPGKQPRSKEDFNLALLRANWEKSAVSEVKKQKKAACAICGGLQRFNTELGGTLNQHIDDNVQSEGPVIPIQLITIEKDSRLAKIAGDQRSTYAPAPGKQAFDNGINSFHHQSIDKLGAGLKVVARADDKYKTIEAMESTDPDWKFMAFQWHPEFMLESPLTKKIVKQFVEDAKEHALKKDKAINAPDAPSSLMNIEKPLVSNTPPTSEKRFGSASR